MGKLLIKNGRVIDPANNVDKKADLLIVGEKIAKIGSVGKDCDLLIDAEGKLVRPAVHTGFENKYTPHQV